MKWRTVFLVIALLALATITMVVYASGKGEDQGSGAKGVTIVWANVPHPQSEAIRVLLPQFQNSSNQATFSKPSGH